MCVLIYIIQIWYIYIYEIQKIVLCPRFVGNHRQHCWWTSNSRLQRLPPSPIEVVPPGHCGRWNLRLAGWLIVDNPSEEVPDKWELVPSTSGNNTLTTRLPIINWDCPSATDVAKPAGVFQQTLKHAGLYAQVYCHATRKWVPVSSQSPSCPHLVLINRIYTSKMTGKE